MVAIDIDVLTLAFAFHRDARRETNKRFLDLARRQDPLVAIYSVLELLGQLSFNHSAERLGQWPLWPQDHFNLTLLYPAPGSQDATAFFQREIVNRPQERMRQHPVPFVDALIRELVERQADVKAFVTWNARHFRGKTPLTVLTPAEYLARQGIVV